MDSRPPDSTHNVDRPSSPGTPPPPGPSTLHYILFGPEGLRAAWGIILFVAIYYAMARCLQPLQELFLHASRTHGDPLSVRQIFTMEGIEAVAVLVAMGLVSRLELRPASAYGLAREDSAKYFFRGLLWGLALLSLLIFLLRAFGLLIFDARSLFGAGVFRYGALWLGAFFLLSVKEELLSRGYLQFTLTRGLRSVYLWLFGARYANTLGFWTAAAALSYLFGVGHSGNSNESPIGLFAAGVFGLLFCLSLWRTGSLWWAIGFHASWDWAQSFLYGVPDSGLLARGHLYATHAIGPAWLSGGLTGPEGSILFLAVALAGAGVMLLTLPRTHKGYLPLQDGQLHEDGTPDSP